MISAHMTAGGNRSEGLREALRSAAFWLDEKRRVRDRLIVDMKHYDLSFQDLGADYAGQRQEEGRELIRRLRQGLKKFGKKELPDLLEAEARKYGVELRGGITQVQSVQNGNTPQEEKTLNGSKQDSCTKPPGLEENMGGQSKV